MTVAKINTSKWKKFEIGHLFEIGRPVSRSQAAYEEGISHLWHLETSIMEL